MVDLQLRVIEIKAIAGCLGRSIAHDDDDGPDLGDAVRTIVRLLHGFVEDLDVDTATAPEVADKAPGIVA